jgi:hypothetical protein
MENFLFYVSLDKAVSILVFLHSFQFAALRQPFTGIEITGVDAAINLCKSCLVCKWACCSITMFLSVLSTRRLVVLYT